MPKKRKKDPSQEEKDLEKSYDKEYKDYISKVKDKNKRYLLKLSDEMKEKIVKTVIDEWYNKDLPHHQEIEDKVDEYGEQWRMTRKTVKGTKRAPNYRQALSTVVLEVIHANVMNVFFAGKDVLNVLPTEPNDIPKIPRLNTFMNWSVDNELKIFNRCDRLFHNSGKTGGTPYKISWSKEYGMETKTRNLENPFNPGEPLLDETGEVLKQEYDEPKLLYNGPKMEVFSRKDYILPENATVDKVPPHEIHRIIKTKDEIIRGIREGKYYDDILDEEKQCYLKWGTSKMTTSKKSREDKEVPLASNEKIFLEAYGGLVLREEDDEDFEDLPDAEKMELEKEYIFLVSLEDRVLVAARKNKFPLKFRSIKLCPFIPDDEGGIDGIGVMEFMENVQLEYDALHNQGLQATVNQNNPIGFFTPLGNQKLEPVEIQPGYMYPTADPKGVNVVMFPGPSRQLFDFMKIVLDWAEKIFPMGEYAAGKISEIDPTAPARKVERILEQINTRLNLIIKRFNIVLKDIFLKHFLLYSVHMPENKFMRITGATDKKPWEFKRMNLSDFALKSLPDFELTGNILSSNKVLEARKATTIYDRMVGNALFSPQNPATAQAYYQLTKWWLDKMDAMGVSKFIPQPKGKFLRSPDDENAALLQGDKIEPDEREDHLSHMRKHNELIANPATPPQVKRNAMEHVRGHFEMVQNQMAKEMMFGRRLTGGEEKRPAKPRETISEAFAGV